MLITPPICKQVRSVIGITLANDEHVVACYEMKDKEVTRSDIDRAIQKVVESGVLIDNYIYITTRKIDADVAQYAASLYRETGGIEFAILDCLGFCGTSYIYFTDSG